MAGRLDFSEESDFRHQVSPRKGLVSHLFRYLLRHPAPLVYDIVVITGRTFEEAVIWVIDSGSKAVIDELDYRDIRYVQFSF